MPAPADGDRPRRRSAAVLRLLVAVVLLGGLLVLVDRERLLAVLGRAAPLPLLGMLVVNSGVFALFAWRWAILCRRLGIAQRFAGAWRGVYLFQLASQVAPPLLGDAARLAAVPAGTATADTVRSLVLDRLANLIGLVATVTVLLPYHAFAGLEGRTVVLLAVPAAVLAAGGTALVVVLRRRAGGVLAFLPALVRGRGGPAPVLLGAAVALGVGLEFQVAAWVLGVDAPADLVLWVPVAALGVSLLPISLGDWGTRELAALAGLAPTGLAAEEIVALSLLVGAANLVSALPGLLLVRGRG